VTAYRDPVPSNAAELAIWDKYSKEIKAMVDESPEVTAAQVREIRAIWLGILSRRHRAAS
jgi:hypothetical protein